MQGDVVLVKSQGKLKGVQTMIAYPNLTLIVLGEIVFNRVKGWVIYTTSLC